MRLLLDTNVVLWAAAEPSRLSAEARGALDDDRNIVVASVVNLWEVVVKQTVGKLWVGRDLGVWLAERDIPVIPITSVHVEALTGLPLHHRDPFDRMLVAQARSEGLTLVTADRRLEAYSVAVMRADAT